MSMAAAKISIRTSMAKPARLCARHVDSLCASPGKSNASLSPVA